MKKILVVDDEIDISESICAILRSDGFAVDSVSNGRDAIKYLSDHENEVSLVILDVMMPFVSGYEVLRFIRKDKANLDLPVILMSAVSPSAKQADFQWNEFLRKPFDLPRFEALIVKYIST